MFWMLWLVRNIYVLYFLTSHEVLNKIRHHCRLSHETKYKQYCEQSMPMFPTKTEIWYLVSKLETDWRIFQFQFYVLYIHRWLVFQKYAGEHFLSLSKIACKNYNEYTRVITQLLSTFLIQHFGYSLICWTVINSWLQNCRSSKLIRLFRVRFRVCSS